MKKKKYINIWASMLLFLVLIVSFMPTNKVFAASTTYDWTSDTTLEDSDGAIYTKLTQEEGTAGTILAKFAGYRAGHGYFYSTEKAINMPFNGGLVPAKVYLWIPRYNPLEGVNISYAPSIPNSLTINGTVIIKNTSGDAPAPEKIISKGIISGLLLRDANLTTTNMNFLNQYSMYLANSDGVTAEETPMQNDPTVGWRYGDFPLGGLQPDVFGTGGILPGRYTLGQTFTRAATCTTGEYDAGWKIGDLIQQTMCAGEVSGAVTIDIAYDETKNDGSGIVKIINEAEGEKGFSGDSVSTTDITVKNGVNVRLHYQMTSPLDGALSGAISTFADWVQATTKWVMDQIDGLLQQTADYVVGPAGCSGETCGVLGPWTAMRNIGLTLLIMALIIIAFTNVLQIDIEQYGLNRMIPKIVISIIMAYTSWIIVVFFFDFTLAIQKQALGLLGGTGGLKVLGGLVINTPSTGDIVGKAGAILLLLVILVAALACGAVLLFSLILRIVMLSFLLSVAPLAFILNIVPFTSSLYKRWWDEFFKWMFMGPVALVIISLGSVIAASVSGSQFGSGATLDASTASGTGGRMLIGLLIFAASMYMAAKLPLEWGGKLMGGWQKAGKFLGRATGVPGGVGQIGKSMGDALTRGRNRRENWFANRGSFGMAGMNPEGFKRNQRAALLNARSKSYEFQDKDEFTKAYKGAASPLAKQAIMLAGMKAGMINDNSATLSAEDLAAGKKPGLAEEIARQADNDSTGLLKAAALKDYRETLITHGETGPNGSAQLAAEDVAKKFSTAKPGELGAITKRSGDLNMGTKGANGAYGDGIGKYAQGITQANVDKLSESQTSAYMTSLTGLTSIFGGPSGVTPKTTASGQQNIGAQPGPTQGPASTEGNEQRPSGLWIPKDRS